MLVRLYSQAGARHRRRMARPFFPLLQPVRQSDRSIARTFGCAGLALVLIVGVAVAAGIVAVLAGISVIEPDPDARPEQLLLLIGVATGALGAAVLIAARVAYGRPFASFLWPSGFRLDRLLTGVVVAVPAMIAGALAAAAVSALQGSPPSLADLPDPPSLDLAYVLAAAGALGLAAAAEEVIFRGVIQQVLVAWVRVVGVALVLQAIAFSAVHADPDPAAFAVRLIMGLTWGWAALRLGGIEFSTGLHLVNNLVLVMLVPLSEAMRVDRDIGWAGPASQTASGLVVVLAVEWLARRSAARARGT